MSSDLNKEKNRLNRLIREKKAYIDKLNNAISDLESLKSERNAIKTETEELEENKSELESSISSSTTKKQSLETEIDSLTNQKNEIDSYLQEFTPIKDTLSGQIDDLTLKKEGLQNIINDLNSVKSDTSKEIQQINQEKNKLDDLIFDLREKYGLYSKDMRDMSKDSITQLNKYSLSAILSIIGAITLMIMLLCILTKSDPFPEKLLKFFFHQPNLRFYSLLTIRLSISAAFIFLIIIFLNLSRGFVSQYIKARNRLTALRVADFLIGRIQSKKNTGSTEEERLKIEMERIQEQVNLLNLHIPKIMDLGSSSFDKVSKTKDPFEQIKELKEIINAGSNS